MTTEVLVSGQQKGRDISAGCGNGAQDWKDTLTMTGKEAIALSKRSETWLRNHECAWCGQTLWLALTSGCGAIYERCDPREKNFGADGKLKK